MAPEEREISDVHHYLREVEEGFVLIDQRERERKVKEIALQVSHPIGGVPADDEELVGTVANLTEFPTAICGAFDKSFLRLPEAVLITAMKEHQKYFAVYDHEGRLMPNFIAVNNTKTRDDSLVQKGHERVLRARLSDADFFFREDRRRTMKDRVEQLRGVIYQAELGTSFDKVQRFTLLAEYVARSFMPHRLDDIRLVAMLCKCDLVTHMVGEFPSLQGIMGREYARLEGYPEEICLAISEHYMPTKSGGACPLRVWQVSWGWRIEWTR